MSSSDNQKSLGGSKDSDSSQPYIVFVVHFQGLPRYFRDKNLGGWKGFWDTTAQNEQSSIWSSGTYEDPNSQQEDSITNETLSYDGSHEKKHNTKMGQCFPGTFVIAVIAIVVVVAIVMMKTNKQNEPVLTAVTADALVCSNNESATSLGEQICFSGHVSIASNLTLISFKHISSNYYHLPSEISITVNSSTYEFTQQVDDWVIDYNISRLGQIIRLISNNVTCRNTGRYKLSLQYENGSNSTSEFQIRVKDPQLEQKTTYIDENIHVSCKLTKSCVPSSLAIYGNTEALSYLLPSTSTCINRDGESGSDVVVQVSLHLAKLSDYASISCVPLMTVNDRELAENLTTTIPICSDLGCRLNCTDTTDIVRYYSDKIYCNIFHQCAHGSPVVQRCGQNTYWEPKLCTCAHFNDTICDRQTLKRLKPLLTFDQCLKNR